MKYTIYTLLFISFMFSSASSQSVGQHTKIELQDGTTINGIIQSTSTETIEVESSLGLIAVPRSNIRKAYYGNSADELKSLGYQSFSDSNILLPTARPVGVGNSHYKNFNLFFNQFNIGVTDKFSLGLGFESLSIFAGDAPRIFYVAPKFSIGSDNSYFGIGTSALLVTDNGESGLGGLFYLNYTYGSARQNFTVGISRTYTSETAADDNVTILNINFSYPVSNRVTFLSEILLGDFDDVLFDLGLRIMFKNGLSIDAGFLRPASSGGGLGFPLLGLTVPFR